MPGTTTKFNKSMHRKYLGKYYFIEPTPDTNGITTRGITTRELETLRECRHPIEDAVRDSNASAAYYEFLEGLQQINQQEYLQDQHCGLLYKDNRQSVLYKIKSALGMKDLSPEEEHLQKLALWEREMRRRANAFQTQLFRNELFGRAAMGVGAEPKEDHRLPIRKETAKLLTRPVEMDWTLLGALAYIVNIFISVYALVQQIRILVLVCPIAFMCPQNTATAGKPIVAPPIAFRNPDLVSSVGFRSYVDAYSPWSAKLKQKCTMRTDPECLDGGYLIQWPYVQIEEGRRGVLPDELHFFTLADGTVTTEERCTVQRRGEEGWVYNVHNQSLTHEYWNCDDNGEDTIPFISAHAGGTTEFSYAPALYEELHARTIDCMKETLDKLDLDGSISDWQVSVIDSGRASEAMTNMRTCITATPLPAGGTCDCNLNNWENFAVGLFYETEPTAKCKSNGDWCKPGIQTKYLELKKSIKSIQENCPATQTDCVAENSTELLSSYSNMPDAFLCPETDACERAYDNEQPLSSSQKYGCWFTSESATEVLPADYESCTGRSLPDAESKYQGMTALQRMKQEALDMRISKRTILIVFFMIKEGTIFTAVALQVVIFLAAFSVLVVIYILVLLPLKLVSNSGRDSNSDGETSDRSLDRGKHSSQNNRVVMINATMVTAKDSILDIIELVGTLCLSLSTVYRTLIKARQVMIGLVNPSIRDMNDKITSVANTVFSLAVLLTLENGNDSGIVSSMVLTLVQLIFQMTLEKMKLRSMKRPLQDLNENRLSKFEVALLWVKIMEEFLSDDVQYNWVQVFNSDAPLKPFDVSFPETLQAKGDRKAYVAHTDYKFDFNRVKQWGGCLGPLKGFFHEMYQAMIDVDERKITYQSMTQTLDPELAVIFGTDGLRELEATEPGKCSGKKLWHGKKPKQSVEYEDVENDNNQGNNNEELKPKISRVRFRKEDTERKLLLGTFEEGAVSPELLAKLQEVVKTFKLADDIKSNNLLSLPPPDERDNLQPLYYPEMSAKEWWEEDMWSFKPRRFLFTESGDEAVLSPTAKAAARRHNSLIGRHGAGPSQAQGGAGPYPVPVGAAAPAPMPGASMSASTLGPADVVNTMPPALQSQLPSVSPSSGPAREALQQPIPVDSSLLASHMTFEPAAPGAFGNDSVSPEGVETKLMDGMPASLLVPDEQGLA